MSRKNILLFNYDIPPPEDMKFAAERLAKDIQILESYGVESMNKEAAKLRSVLEFIEQINIQRRK